MTAPAAGEDHERASRSQGVNSGAMRAVTGYLRRNSSLLVGLALLFGIIAFAVIGGLFVDPQNARPLSTRPLQPPSWALPFGSDRQGRNLFAVITSGTLLTLRVGLIAGGLGVTIGAALAFDVEASQRPDKPFLQSCDEGADIVRATVEIDHHVSHALAGTVIGELAAASGFVDRKAGLDELVRLGAGAGSVERRVLEQPG